MTTIDRERGNQPGRSGPTRSATSRRCSPPPRLCSSPPVSRRQCVISRLELASGWGRFTATFRARADLVVAVYRHQVEACAEAGPVLLADGGSPHAALGQWVNLFVDFLVTKHGLAAVLQPDSLGFDALHAYFLDRLVPVCAQLLDAAAEAGEISADTDAYELMRGIGNLCVGGDSDPRYNARRMVELLIAGLLQSCSTRYC